MSSVRLLSQVFALSVLVPLAAHAQAAGAPAEHGAGNQTGIASWYGAWHDGKRTSSGETFHQDGMTAASHSLPLGMHVRVTLADTGQSVVVKINDRMGARSAIIDLSRGAAREIGLLGRGRGMVSVEPTADRPVEVAEASEDEAADVPDMVRGRARLRTRSLRQAYGARPCCHGAALILAHHAVHAATMRRRV